MENNEYIPKLTLTPSAAVAMETEVPVELDAIEKEIPVEKLELNKLSEGEQAAVREFAKQIDIKDTNMILTYGANSQKNIAEFSSTALNAVRTKDLGEVGEMLSGLVVELKGFTFDESEKKGFAGFFKKSRNKIAGLKAQYDKAEVNVDKITSMLDSHWLVLSKDIAMLDKMYQKNQTYFKELSMYILAGKLRIEELRETELPALRQKAETSGLPEDAQEANDFANMLERFEKKLHDLELTRIVSIQMAPQIRLIQNNDSLMAEKIQTSIVNTIPLWKSQMVLALSMEHSKQAMEAQREVTNVTNELLRKNAEALKTGSVEVAKESERGVVDLETLKHTNQKLIETLTEVRKIQDDGRAKRREAEVELGRIEGELKQTLLEMK
ncbi:toxic anion resistance protein [Clostridiaceae bacterium OttesenSCG-928-D20]|nr:toxic anion resistance protein [Clostridiaceae bacterium OttesenSCG-928-D20]